MVKPEKMKATIGLPQAVALYIGAVLGSGVLLVPGLAADMAGPASLLSWGLMTVFVLPMALVMGLLSAKYPNTGGVSHFVTKAFGERAGTLVGWFFLMSVPIGAPVAAITGATYLTTAIGLGRIGTVAIAIAILLVGLVTNLIGMKMAGKVQVAVVIAILVVLVMAVIGSVPSMHGSNFTPFLSHGWVSVGRATAILFWCFIGWEAVSHLSEEFIDPKREAIKGVTIAAMIVGILYFLTALSTIGTRSYGPTNSAASLVLVIEHLLGKSGAFVAGGTAVFICTATVIAYVGAASRLAFALSKNGNAPKSLSLVATKYGTPLGGILFLAICFTIVVALYSTNSVPLTVLIQLPNATFILTYLGGCAAGIRLLRDSKWSVCISWISFLLTAIIFPFVGWGLFYPVLIVSVFWMAKNSRKPLPIKLKRRDSV
ncbi:APC family permease [Alicyclobacillus dauci]|uniref:Amino acid permease n=1 Tax=Alicyclobacillus dauci TaxID=1475485 RepID=A0ABY6Z131_9BACL|nr:amino acid permease [Alicyclobacillus dauci]WAH36298.1 amino acid permease [Alicyclobacillus dauci]